jgi:predicted nucleic acid-binding Zn finger protein
MYVVKHEDNTYEFNWNYEYGFSLKEQEELRLLPISYGAFQRVLEDEWDTYDKTFLERELINYYERSKKQSAVKLIYRKKFTKAERNVIWGKYFKTEDGYCVLCKINLKRDGKWDCSHIISLKNGGTNDISNLTVECSSCNRSHQDINLDQWLKSRGLLWIGY